MCCVCVREREPEEVTNATDCLLRLRNRTKVHERKQFRDAAVCTEAS